MPSSTFLPNGGPSDNGVTRLDFTDVTYVGTGTLIPAFGGYSISGGSASVSGTQTPFGAGVAGPFAVSDSRISGLCDDLPGTTTLGCEINFGTVDDFNFLVNGQIRHFAHRVNVTAIPEVATALLVSGGLLGLGMVGSRRRRAR